MMKVLLGIVLAFCIVNYGIDFLFYLKNRYCRFHIGRWDEQEWPAVIERTARRWVKHTPTVKITDNSRYMLLVSFRASTEVDRPVMAKAP